MNAGGTCVLMARLKNADATYPEQADVESVRVDVYEIVAGEDPAPVDLEGEEITDDSAADEPAAGDVIFDELQTDDAWTADSTGYNFRYEFSAPVRDKRYEVRVTIELESGDTLVSVWQLLSK